MIFEELHHMRGGKPQQYTVAEMIDGLVDGSAHMHDERLDAISEKIDNMARAFGIVVQGLEEDGNISKETIESLIEGQYKRVTKDFTDEN